MYLEVSITEILLSYMLDAMSRYITLRSLDMDIMGYVTDSILDSRSIEANTSKSGPQTMRVLRLLTV